MVSVKVMPEPTTMDDLDAMKGSPLALSGVLEDVVPVPRRFMSSTRGRTSCATEHENHARHSAEVKIHARCAKCKEIVAKCVFPSELGTFKRLSHQN